ncbi:MAG: GH25 family lysozyme [Prevotella sp.]
MNTRLVITIFITGILLCACSDKTPTLTSVISSGEYSYRGEVKDGKAHGFGVLLYKNSLVYYGQWQLGQRNGYGISIDSCGRKIHGEWKADTIVTAVVVDSTGVYTGEMDKELKYSGHGTFSGVTGNWYKGAWNCSKMNGFGCAITSEGKIKVGEWSDDRYQGERLTYTSDRIYGIDISRYQHGKGRKKHPIIWSKLRIKNLGHISNKRINGAVNYPVSFVYIKSTEGTTIRNPYYLSDYRQARANGIKCGAYHFFSTKSSASKQALYFIKNTKFSKGDLPPVLDVEPSEKQIKDIGGEAALFQAIRRWMYIVRQHTGMNPILYVSQQFVNKHLSSAPDIMRDYFVWIARYGEYKPEIRLLIWQLSPDGKVNGIHGHVDINVFNGYSDLFNEFLSKETMKKLPQRK